MFSRRTRIDEHGLSTDYLQNWKYFTNKNKFVPEAIHRGWFPNYFSVGHPSLEAIKGIIGNHKKEYIRAYYLSEQELHKLIIENSKFSQKQLTSLVTFSGASLSKKTRQKLISIIEDRQMWRHFCVTWQKCDKMQQSTSFSSCFKVLFILCNTPY